ncbi:MAG: GDYXXLXY domain-containing protein [Proteobacteria bacterium]|nr:GDYXXLXY domain-containing protein [Pseudomonadota bacterium]
MNSHLLWNKLAEQDLVLGQKPEDHEHIPWYIRFMQGFAGWLAAMFLLGFFVATFGLLFRSANSELLITGGILCSVAAYVVIRLQKNDFFDQIGVALSLCGQLLFAFGLFMLKLDLSVNLFILGFYQLFLAKVIAQYAHRLITALFGVLIILFAINSIGLYGFGSAFLAVLFAFIWIKESSWNKSIDLWEPVGYGIALTMVFSSGFLLTGKHLIQETFRSGSGWLFEHSHLISSLITALIFLNLVLVLLKENKVAFDSKTAILGFLAAAGLILISFKISGIRTALLIVIIGFARQRTILIVFGWLSVVGFFSWYYYNLQATLLDKSIILIVLGVAMLTAWLGIRYIYGATNDDKTSKLKPKTFDKNKYLAIATMAVVLLAINLNIYKKEDLIKNGEVLLFKLAPVDPRSLMQGDYMRLRFDLESKIVSATDLWNQDRTFKINKGFAIVKKAENNVISYIGIFKDQSLKDNQRLIPFKIKNRKVIFTTNAFYFQEGKAEHFQKSEYGEFRISKDGELILANMVDEKFKVL